MKKTIFLALALLIGATTFAQQHNFYTKVGLKDVDVSTSDSLLVIDGEGTIQYRLRTAEQNVQANWSETDTGADSYIQNKPAIPTDNTEISNGAGYLTTETDPVYSASPASNVTTGEITDWNDHLTDQSNPHDVTPAQLNLENVDNTSDIDKPISTATQNALDAKIDLSEKGANNGVATLDPGGKVPMSQLPASLMIYKGVWNAATNTPALADGSGTTGWVWKASPGGTVNFGSGAIEFKEGDWAIYNGTEWERSGSTESVVSVNGQQGIVVLDSDNIAEGGNNKYYTDARARNAVSATGDLSYNASTGVFSYTETTPTLQEVTDSGNGTSSSIIINSADVTNEGFVKRAAISGGWQRTLTRFENTVLSDHGFDIGIYGDQAEYFFAWLGFGDYTSTNTLRIYPDGTLRAGTNLIWNEGDFSQTDIDNWNAKLSPAYKFANIVSTDFDEIYSRPHVLGQGQTPIDANKLTGAVAYYSNSYTTNAPGAGIMLSFVGSTFGLQIRGGDSGLNFDSDELYYRNTRSDATDQSAAKGTWYRLASREWVTDQSFATSADVPTDNAELTNGAGYLTTESDPSVPAQVKAITTNDIDHWNATVITPGSIAIWKAIGNTDKDSVEAGDYVQGIIGGKLIEAVYNSGDPSLLASYTILLETTF